MKEFLLQYVIAVYKAMPSYVYEGLGFVLCVGAIILLLTKGIKIGAKLISGLVLIEYVLVIFFLTVFSRTNYVSPRYNFQPFWSYETIFAGQSTMPSADMVMNVIVFIPIGMLLGYGFNKMKLWRALLIGCGISVTIEVMQFVLKKGFSEVDDVMHNTIGCLIGYGIYSLVRMGYEKVSKKECGCSVAICSGRSVGGAARCKSE